MANISANLWIPKLPFRDPVTGELSSGPFPAVVIVSGTDAPQSMYLGMAHGLAERGYVVLTFDPQGQGLSDADPDPAYCDPAGAWRQPQELGVRELGSCAGVRQAQGDGSTLYDERFYLDQRLNGPTYESYEPHYTRTEARFIFGAFDAVAWLLSEANPERDLVDATRVGIAGHSLGAHAALNVGNGDPERRFAAAVVWDTFGPMLETVSPTVPTMVHHGDREEWYGPYEAAPDPDSLPGSGWRERFRVAEIDSALVVLRGSTHYEWYYVPNALINPVCRPPLCTASRKGERVALYYSLAWLDRYLKGRSTSPVRADEDAQELDARRRLVVRTFDASIDGSSIGHGAWDAAAQRNAPYTIAGEAVGDHLSFYPRGRTS